MASPRTPGRRARFRRSAVHDLALHARFPLVFDGAWYLARYPDVLGAGLDPLDHLMGSGLTEGRDPGPYVDLSYVATLVPDLAGDPHAVLRHVLDRALVDGDPVSPFVDVPWYRHQHGLQSASPTEVFEHLVTLGRQQHLPPSPFVDLEWYRHRYPDISLSGIDPFDYFVSIGQWLGRFPHPLWDETQYIAGNEYVRYAMGVGKYATGFEHFCATGHTEVARGAVALPIRTGGRSDEYAEEPYLSANPDVAEAIAAGAVRNGVEHLFGSGHRETERGQRRLKDAIPVASAVLEAGGAAPQHDWLVILVHFDPHGRIDPHVLTALAAYRSAGADVCLATVGLDDAVLEAVRPHVTFVVRKSTNDDLRDFGSWHLALELLGDEVLERYPQVVLTNDSAYFPVQDPEPFLAAMRASEADVFAATDSLSGGRYHLQSYFLAFRRGVLARIRGELTRRVREQVEATKLTLIQRFEVGLSGWILENGLSTEAYCTIADVVDVAAALNPPDVREISHLGVAVTNLTHHFWRSTLDRGLPFLKVELLRDNPVEVAIDGWEERITGACDAQRIADHLARVRQ